MPPMSLPRVARGRASSLCADVAVPSNGANLAALSERGTPMPAGRQDSPTKKCTDGDCGRPVRARNLCGTHYNQAHQPNRHVPRLTVCTTCGVAIRRRVHADRQHYCSVDCRNIGEYGGSRGSGSGAYSWSKMVMRRARDAGVPVVDVFDRIEVFERDGWMCYLCKKATDRDASVFDPRSPTVDHVIPLSLGAASEHSLANARTACLGCNSAKQARLVC